MAELEKHIHVQTRAKFFSTAFQKNPLGAKIECSGWEDRKRCSSPKLKELNCDFCSAAIITDKNNPDFGIRILGEGRLEKIKPFN